MIARAMSASHLVASDPAPAQQLRRSLAAARERGQRFDDAWPFALQAALASAPRTERRHWRTVLQGTREAWRLAYELRPSDRPCQALTVLEPAA